MFALITNGKIVAACVGDINTGEIYGYGPANSQVWRYSREFHNPVPLLSQTNISFNDLYIISNSCNHDKNGSNISALEDKVCRQFKGRLVQNSSIGVIMAQLWTGDVSAIFLDSHYDTPWDNNPVAGISSALGYKSYRVCADTLELLPDRIVTETSIRPYQTLIANPNLVRNLKDFKI